ncbi:hypothetical protein CV632_01305 [Geobacillus thermodenitrificans]|uniref:DUF6602 domain-containing protein n=1 Tax=Geobacillus thermodenitrificans TaxID=33940 RepID=UPI000C287F82|nr:DUF6602 domain-containing protein [Geobacillus thermodenitrificans]PJW21989.1 hypothetical protein CV632_01305 [Geobacillus thermodenitrificans]
MTVDRYFAEIASEIKRESDKVKIGFSTHTLSAGENREDIVRDFLKNYIPKAYGVDTGLILSSEGEFSNQADLVIFDQLYNTPLYPTSTNKLWFVESIYALIEVKTHLNPDSLNDSIEKCKKFKKLKRNYSTVPNLPTITDSLFILWAFNGPSEDTIKQNILNSVKDLDVEEQPDFIIIPDKILVWSGTHRRLAKFGMPNSPYQAQILEAHPGKSYEEIFDTIKFLALGENTLFIWLMWLTSWLKAAGNRSAPLESYLDQGKIYGIKL